MLTCLIPDSAMLKVTRRTSWKWSRAVTLTFDTSLAGKGAQPEGPMREVNIVCCISCTVICTLTQPINSLQQAGSNTLGRHADSGLLVLVNTGYRNNIIYIPTYIIIITFVLIEAYVHMYTTYILCITCTRYIQHANTHTSNIQVLLSLFQITGSVLTGSLVSDTRYLGGGLVVKGRYNSCERRQGHKLSFQWCY